jgi:hypothetical protein
MLMQKHEVNAKLNRAVQLSAMSADYGMQSEPTRPIGYASVAPRGYETLERIPQKLADFCDKNALQHIDLARFLIARTMPFERKTR